MREQSWKNDGTKGSKQRTKYKMANLRQENENEGKNLFEVVVQFVSNDEHYYSLFYDSN